LCYRGVGKWILRLMQGFFETGSGSSEPEDLTKKGTFANAWDFAIYILLMFMEKFIDKFSVHYY
jgi:hypothetical protein